MNEYRMLIGGELVPGVASMKVINPANEQVVAYCPIASQEQLDDAVGAAKSAFQSWRKVPLAERSRLLHALSAAVAEHAEELALLLTR